MNAAMSTSVSNQIFDWGRFTAALRKELVENKRQLLLIVVSIFLFFTVFMVIGNIISNSMAPMTASDPKGRQLIDLMPAIIVMMCYSFIVMIVASLAFRNLTSKTGRVALFTSPASMTEKFTVNLVVYVIGAFVAFLVCAHLADLARIAILTPFKSKTFYVPGPMNFLSILTSSSADIMTITDFFEDSGYTASNFKLMTILAIFLGPAMYFMGSVLWPRWAVIKTFATQQVLNSVVNVIAGLIVASPILIGASWDKLSNIDGSKLMDAISLGNYISYAIALVCWYGAWYLFKRKDVVSLKWWS